MHKPQTDRATPRHPFLEADRHGEDAEPQTASILAQSIVKDHPTPAASLFGSAPDNDAFPMSGLDAKILTRLVHDLLGPVRALSDIPGWLLEDLSEAGLPLPEGSDRMTALLDENAQKAYGILAGLTRWIEAATRVPDCSDCRLSDVLSDLAIPSDIMIDLVTPNLKLPVDPADLRDILGEAIGNAIRFHPHGTPHLEISGRLSDRMWELEVLDDGPGIGHLQGGDPFRPMEGCAVGGRAAGIGFGLSIIAQIAARHDGDARLSDRGTSKGSVLFVTGRV